MVFKSLKEYMGSLYKIMWFHWRYQEGFDFDRYVIDNHTVKFEEESKKSVKD